MCDMIDQLDDDLSRARRKKELTDHEREVLDRVIEREKTRTQAIRRDMVSRDAPEAVVRKPPLLRWLGRLGLA